jgi:hypothetical protein
MMMDMSWGMHLVWWPLVAALVIIPLWRICEKLGFPGILSVLALVPILNLGLLYFLAFSEPPHSNTSSRL